MADKNEIMIVDEQSLKEKIYIIRGQQVILDVDLAEIYGYTTKAFNQQVNRNRDKFDDDFVFKLTREEVNDLVRSQNVTSRTKTMFQGQSGGSRYLPNAFTESGIYMLMTVLKGELAVKQSKTLIRLFKSMKDYIIENQQLMITHRDYVALATKVNENSSDIKEVKDKLENTVTRTELTDFMKLFDSSKDAEETLIFDGDLFKADVAYQKIYKKAKKNIILVDDYLGVKTLQHLVHAKANVQITIISDNKGKKPLRKSEYDDFKEEYPDIKIDFIKSSGKVHDRYIVLDYGTKDMKVYFSGASVKDAGKRLTTIVRLGDVSGYKDAIKKLLTHTSLPLK